MAVLKDLIVHGPSRFLNGINANSIKADTINAKNGYFKYLKAIDGDIENLSVEELLAQKATVVGLLDVKGELHTNTWTNSNIANIGGVFYISPTVISTSANVVIGGNENSRTLTVSGGSFATTTVPTWNGTTESTSGWVIGSRVMVTGSVTYNNVEYPLGTCIGYISGALTSSGFTVQQISSEALESIFAITGTNSLSGTNIQISMYEIGPGNNNNQSNNASYKPVGILMTSYGMADKSTHIDIYGGVNAKNTSSKTSGMADPNVRIGHLGGLDSYTDSAGNTRQPTGWGIYTDNGYFKGVIVADSGSIGHFTIDANAIYSGEHSAYNTSGKNGIFIGRTSNTSSDYYVSGGPGALWYLKSDGSAKIGAMTLSAAGVLTLGSISLNSSGTATIGPWIVNSTSIYKGSATQGAAGTGNMYFGNNGLSISNTFTVSNTGKLYASGAKISGDLTASSLSTGGRTSSTAAAGTYIDAYGAIYGGNNKFTVTKEGALTAEGAVLNNLYFKDQYKIYGFLGWTTSESSGLIGSYEITSDWYEEHARDSTLVLTYAYTNSFSSPFILKKNGDIIPTSTNYYQISTSISINTVTVTINLTTVGVDDGDEFSVYATNKNNTHYYIALNGYDNFYKYGQGSFSCGESCEASGIFSTAIGRSVKVTGIGSFGQGREHKVTGPYCSATGVNNTVNTYFSHAEGGYNLIDEGANVAHAEGWHTTITADGNGAHTEGGYTTATAQSAHAEGDYTLASGAESHAGGYYTIAQGMCQTVIGAFNKAIGTPNSVSDRTVPVFIIGNGTGTSEDSRSNALTVDWAGNVKASGDITANNHDSPIGTYRAQEAQNKRTSSNGTESASGSSITLGAGSWVVEYVVVFSAGSGTRSCSLYNGSTYIDYSRIRLAAATTGKTILNGIKILKLKTDSTINLYAGHAGISGAQGYNALLSAVRIA